MATARALSTPLRVFGRRTAAAGLLRAPAIRHAPVRHRGVAAMATDEEKIKEVVVAW